VSEWHPKEKNIHALTLEILGHGSNRMENGADCIYRSLNEALPILLVNIAEDKVCA
jgi:hypothetical protein